MTYRSASYILVKKSGIPEEHFAFKNVRILKLHYFNFHYFKLLVIYDETIQSLQQMYQTKPISLGVKNCYYGKMSSW